NGRRWGEACVDRRVITPGEGDERSDDGDLREPLHGDLLISGKGIRRRPTSAGPCKHSVGHGGLQAYQCVTTVVRVSPKGGSAYEHACSCRPVCCFQRRGSTANHRAKDVQVFNRSVSALSDGTRKGVRLNEQPGEGVAYLKGIEFSNGTIEFDVRGKDVQGQ